MISKGIRPEHFADLACRDAYFLISDHARQYKVVPSSSAFKAERPDFELLHVSDPLEYLLDRFVAIVKRRVAQDMAVELAKQADDPDSGDTIDLKFLEMSREMAMLVPSTQVARFKDMEKRIMAYEKRRDEGKSTGIPFGFPQLDAWTGGIQPHEFVTVAGFSGLGKSTLLMVIAFNAWLEGYTPLYISLEMQADAILRKFDAMAAGLDYWKLKNLSLEGVEIDNWREKAAAVASKPVDIPVIDSIRGCSPDHVWSETVRHKPDLVILDYLSLMRSGRPNRNSSLWQSLTEITQDMKQNARTLKIPVLAAAQTNRSGGKDGAELDNIGYSISVIQDSDIVLGLYADDEMREAKEMEIRLSKNRDGRLGVMRTVWDHDNMNFRQKGLQDMFKRQRGDEATETPG